MVSAFFCFSALFFLAAIYPFTIYPLILCGIRAWYRPNPVCPVLKSEESFAVCVCAYNEEAVIAQKVENLLALRKLFPDIHILVYVDAATDRTAEILQRYKDGIDIYVSDRRRGKTYGMNLLVSRTQASIVIFTDANVMLDVKSLRTLPGYFADPRVGCVCGHLQYVNENATVTAKNGSLYWRIEEFIKKMESDTGSVMGADGSIFAIRRSLHVPPPDDIIDDMFVSFSILCDGCRVVFAPEIVAYEKSATSSREEFRRKIRIACQAFNVHRLLWPKLRYLEPLDLYKYLSHKFIRWFAIYWLVLAVLAFEAGMLAVGAGLTGILLVGLVFSGFYAGFTGRLPVVIQVMDILRAFAATGLGVWHSVLGDHFQVWSPASSARSS